MPGELQYLILVLKYPTEFIEFVNRDIVIDVLIRMARG